MSEKTMLPDVDALADHDEALLLQYTLPTTRNLFDPKSARFLDEMLPQADPLTKELLLPFRIAECTPGEVFDFNLERLQRVPKVKGTSVAFIPLELATAYVRRVTGEMKRLDKHYREQARQLVQRGVELEAELKRMTDINERLRAVNDRNAKTVSGVNQMRIDFANYRKEAEATLEALKEEIHLLLEERAALRADLEKACSASSKEKDEELVRLRREVQALEPARQTQALLMQHETLQQQLRTGLSTKSKVSSELQQWTADFEQKHRRMPSQKDFNSVAHLQLQTIAFEDSLTPVLMQLAEVRSQLLALGFSLPQEEKLAHAEEERDAQRVKLQHMKTLASELERTSIEKSAIQKELDDLKRLMAVPHRTDPETTALRSQVEYLSSELTTRLGAQKAPFLGPAESHLVSRFLPRRGEVRAGV